MTLHIVSNCNALNSCLEVAAISDPIILIGDGVYALQSHTAKLNPHLLNDTLFALTEDMHARGIKINPVAIDYPKFVALSTEHNPIQSWY